jgi:hypothetical protein
VKGAKWEIPNNETEFHPNIPIESFHTPKGQEEGTKYNIYHK